MIMASSQLLSELTIIDSDPHEVFSVFGIEHASTLVRPGYIFICIKGYATDGHRYVNEAVANGARLIIAEDFVETTVPVLYVSSTKQALEHLANRFYGQPHQKLRLHAITGTNGKTTSAYFTYQLLKKRDVNVGYIGTTGIWYADQIIPTRNTTPDALVLNRTLADMVQSGVTDCVMEVSSQAIAENRTTSLRFDTISFTNLSHDHLDYHKTMERYGETKASLFTQFKPSPLGAILNGDDVYHEKMARMTPESIPVIKFSTMDIASMIYGRLDDQMVYLVVDGQVVNGHSPVLETYNLENLLCAIAILELIGHPITSLRQYVSDLELPRGRMERIESTPKPVFIDYGHTPDAIRLVMQELSKRYESILVLLSSAGERDQSKRSQMARIVSEYSQSIILTVHDPRHENPERIVKDLLSGIPSTAVNPVCFLDRQNALQHLAERCIAFDCSIVFGKGHDRYERINGELIPFDERQLITTYFNDANTLENHECN